MSARRHFDHYVGIDYSGAQTPTASLPGLRVYQATHIQSPTDVLPPASPRKYWTRRGIAEWLVEQLLQGRLLIVGIDHAFSFPLPYFKKHRLALEWPAFLEDFQRHWPTDRDHMYVDFIRDGVHGDGAIAKSTHAGLPWLRFIREKTEGRVHFWPFDGWTVPSGRSAIVEVYPRLWNRMFQTADLSRDQHDAYCIAAWLRRADPDGTLASALEPELDQADRAAAEIEGWILGVLPQPSALSGQRIGDARQAGSGTVPRMPEISRFLGIVIRMFYTEHGVPHFHAQYGRYQVSVEVRSSRVHGTFPPTALRLVLEWAGLHRDELLANWDLARRKKPLIRIEPLE
jgi:hypothetical protein